MELAPLYRDIVEKSPDGIWVFDLEGRTLYANPALRQLFGVDEEEGEALNRALLRIATADPPRGDPAAAHG